jgi:hypothetical protein
VSVTVPVIALACKSNNLVTLVRRLTAQYLYYLAALTDQQQDAVGTHDRERP